MAGAAKVFPCRQVQSPQEVGSACSRRLTVAARTPAVVFCLLAAGGNPKYPKTEEAFSKISPGHGFLTDKVGSIVSVGLPPAGFAAQPVFLFQ